MIPSKRFIFLVGLISIFGLIVSTTPTHAQEPAISDGCNTINQLSGPNFLDDSDFFGNPAIFVGFFFDNQSPETPFIRLNEGEQLIWDMTSTYQVPAGDAQLFVAILPTSTPGFVIPPPTIVEIFDSGHLLL